MHPTVRACSRCRCSLEPGDKFCQECGLSVPAVRELEAPRIEGRLISPTQIKQEIKNSRGPAQPVSQPAPSSTEPAAEKPASTPVLHSPLLAPREEPRLPGLERLAEPTAELGAKPRTLAMLDLACLTAVLAFAFVLTFWVFSTAKKAEVRTVSSKRATAHKAWVNQDFYRSIAALNELANFVKLDENELSMLDKAHLQLGKSAMARGDNASAALQLAAVRQESTLFTQAQPLLMALAVALPEQTEVTPARRLVQPVERRYVPAPALSDDHVFSLPSLSQLKKESQGENAVSEEVQTEESQQEEEAALPKFSERDLSIYNKQLANFLIKEPGNQAPTFKEWLQSGKAAF